MASLTDKRIKNTYDGLLKTTDNDPLGGSYKLITDGLGNSSNVYLGTGGAVGIGQTTPRGKFDVDGEVYVTTPNGVDALKISDSSVKIGDYDDANGYAFLHLDSQVFKFTTDSVEVMRITSSGNVGIGTTSPNSKLEVAGIVGNFKTTGHQIFLTRNGNNEIYAVGASSVLALGTNSAEKMRISSNGNIGINTNNPQSKLSVDSGSNGTAGFISVDSQGASRLKLGYSFTAAPSAITAAQIYADSSGNLDISSRGNSSSKIQFYTSSGASPAERMRIDSSGNVGIGTTSPTSNLHVRGDNPVININDSNNTSRYACLAFSTAGGSWRISSGDSTTGTSSNLFITRGADGTSNRFVFDRDLYRFGVYDNTNTLKAVIRANGNSYFAGGDLGVGTTSPSNKLEVVGSYSSTPLKILRHGDYGNVINLGRNGVSETAHIGYPSDATINFSTAGTERMRIDSSGNVGIGTTSLSSPLTVKSNSTSSGNSGLRIEANGSTDAIVLIGEKSGNKARFHMYNAGVEKIAFYTDGTDNHISEGNVGIGTTSPGAKLEVRTGSGKQLRLSTGATTYWELGRSTSTGHFEITEDSGDTYFLINKDNGKVGIGTVNPSEQLHVTGASTTKVQISSTSTTGISGVHFGDPDDVNMGRVQYEHMTDHMGIFTNNAERIRIDSSGNVGIGGTTLTGWANKQVVLDGGSNASAAFVMVNNTTGRTGTDGSVITLSGSDMYLIQRESANMIFRTANAERMRIDSSGKIGIGTTSPGGKLDVAGNTDARVILGRAKFDNYVSDYLYLSHFDQGSATNYALNQSPAGSTSINAPTGQNVALKINNSAKLHIQGTTGNVGIGTTSPTYLLHVAGSANIENDLTFGIGGFLGTSTSNFTMFSLGDLIYNADSNNNGDSNHIFKESGNELMRINSSGNVGIGTTSPQAKLEVGNCDSSGNVGDGNIAVKTNSNNTAIVIQESSGAEQWGIGVNVDGDLIFTDSGTERIRFDDGTGNVGIGTSSPAKKLTVSASDDVVIRINSTKNGTWTSGDSLGAVEFFGNDASGGQQAGIKGKIDVVSYNEFGAAFDMKFFTSNGSADPTTENFKIAYDGGIFAPALSGGTSISNPMIRYNTSTKEFYYQSSSLRYKEEVENLDSQIDKLMNLRTVKFKIKDTNENAIGLIAEEVVEVIPELTFKNKVEGFDEPQIEGVSYGDLPTYLLKAIQEQQEMINELKTEIQTLKSQINL